MSTSAFAQAHGVEQQRVPSYAVTMCKLCDYTEICLCLKGIKHLYNVLMLEIPENLYLLPEILDVLLAFAVLHDEFHGCNLSGELASALIYLVTACTADHASSCGDSGQSNF